MAILGCVNVYDYSPATFKLSLSDGSFINFDSGSETGYNIESIYTNGGALLGDRRFKADSWTFPAGVIISFAYATEDQGWGPGTGSVLQVIEPSFHRNYLTSVSNNLGRQLTFTSSDITTGYGGGIHNPPVTGFLRQITSVTDEAGRSVNYALSNCPSNNYFTASTSSPPAAFPAALACNTFTVTDPLAHVTSYTYQAGTDSPDPVWIAKPSYLLRRWFTPDNATTPYQTFAYDSDYRAASATDILGLQTRYYAGGFGDDWLKIGSEIDPLGNVTASQWDRWNDVLQSVDPLGRAGYKAYDSAHRPVLASTPLGVCTATTYDVRNNDLSSSLYPAGACSAAGLVLALSPSPGTPIVTSTAYGVGSDLSTASSPSTVLVCANLVTCNKVVGETDGNGNVSSYSWDSTSGNLTQILPPKDSSGNQPQTNLVYTPLTGATNNCSNSATAGGLALLCQQTAAISASSSLLTTYTYNASNKYVLASATVDPSGLDLVTQFTFNAYGDVTAVQNPRTDVTSITNYIWDVDRRLNMTIEPTAASGYRTATRYDFDADSQLIETDKGHSSLAMAGNAAVTVATANADFTAQESATNVFDADGRKIQTWSWPSATTSPATSALAMSQYDFDADDRPTCVAVRMNPASYGSLPASACSTPLPTAGTYGNDRLTQTNYDAAGEKTSEVRGYGSPHQVTYETDQYTLDGKLYKLADANGNLTTYSYDGFDRLSQTTFPSTGLGAGTSDTNDYETYTYDNDNNRLSLRKRDASTITYVYDALNREITKHWPTGGGALDVYSGYDLLNHKLYANYASAGGQGVAYSYDVSGRLLTEAASASGLTLSYAYDQAGNRKRVTWPDSFYATYAFDGANNLSSVTDSGGVAVASFTYDSLGRRSALSEADGSGVTYQYDGLDRLSPLTQTFASGVAVNNQMISFAYNPASQILTRTGTNGAYDYTGYAVTSTAKTYDGLNRDATIAAIGTTPCSASGSGYDCNGNLTNDGQRTFAYDSENRLISASISATSTNATLAYDPLGRLQTYSVQVGAGSPTATTFLYAGDQLSAEYNGTTLLRRYVHGVGTDVPLVWYEGSAASADRRYLHADNQGSIIAWSDATPSVTTISYGAYGEPQAWSGSRFSYTGQIMLPEISLYHYKARVYDPSTGRFLQTDPVGYQDNVDLYDYVGDDPTDKGDPGGTIADDNRLFAGGGPSVDGSDSRTAKQIEEDTKAAVSAGDATGCKGNYSCEKAVQDATLPKTDKQWRWFAVPALAPEFVVAGLEFAGAAGIRGVAAAAKDGCGCFVAGTLVETDHGLRPIEQIKIGELVRSRDPATGVTGYKPVVGLLRPHNRPIYVVKIGRTGSGFEEAFSVTGDHPWKSRDGRWLTTLQLVVGDQIQTENGGGVIVISVVKANRSADTYNLEVAQFHTYFVGRGHVWVHNANCDKAASSIWRGLQNWRQGLKTDGNRIFSWDHLHNEIEVFTKRGEHLGAMDPETGQMIKDAVPGRTINVR